MCTQRNSFKGELKEAWVRLHLAFYDKTHSAQKSQKWLCLDSIRSSCTYGAVNSSTLHFPDAGRFPYIKSTWAYFNLWSRLGKLDLRCLLLYQCICVHNCPQHLNEQINVTFPVWHLRLGHIWLVIVLSKWQGLFLLCVFFSFVFFFVAQFIPYIWSVLHCTTWFIADSTFNILCWS